ncbi:MAG TPA: amino acid permease [Bryobacteraceae bacterium]|nr:amino acid permease [Bryobacteraceae bacterium]
MSQSERPQLLRAVGLFSLTAIAVNGMVGSGIFVLPAQVAKLLGPAGISAYFVAGVAAGLIVLCFAEVGALFDRSGGPYLYARAAFGEFVGFEIGWMMLLARLTAMAAICNAFASYLGYFWPWAGAGAGRVVVIVGSIAFLTVINYRGVQYGTWTVNLLTVSKLAPLLIFVFVGLFFLDPHRPPAWTVPQPSALRQASLLLIFAFGGFEFAVVPGEEVQRPRRNIPIALLTGIGFVAALYVMIQYVAQGTLPELGSSPTPLASASRNFLGPLGGALLTAGAVFSTTGTNSALMLVTPRILFAMSEGGHLPKIFARVHPRFRTPYVAVIATAIVGCLCAMYSGFASLAAISAIARLLTYMSTSAALPVLRRTMPDAERLFRVPGKWAIPIASIAISAWLLMGSTQAQILISAATLAAGVIVFVVNRSSRPAAS